MTSSEELTPEEADEIFGSRVEPIPPDDREMELALVLRRLRSLLIEAAEKRGVGVTELASRLEISPSVVSRMLRSEGDMRVSTAVEWAHALDFAWDFILRDRHAAAPGANFFIVGQESPSLPASVAEPPQIREVELPNPKAISDQVQIAESIFS